MLNRPKTTIIIALLLATLLTGVAGADTCMRYNHRRIR